MLKTILLLALVVVGASAIQGPGNPESAPEPYSYQYETDSHSASESKDANGKVTGFYTIVDADGRQRRVDYEADESGFRAKVQTNEVGTKSSNPADVEILASEPNREQFVQSEYSRQQQVVQQGPPQPQGQYQQVQFSQQQQLQQQQQQQQQQQPLQQFSGSKVVSTNQQVQPLKGAVYGGYQSSPSGQYQSSGAYGSSTYGSGTYGGVQQAAGYGPQYAGYGYNSGYSGGNYQGLAGTGYRAYSVQQPQQVQYTTTNTVRGVQSVPVTSGSNYRYASGYQTAPVNVGNYQQFGRQGGYQSLPSGQYQSSGAYGSGAYGSGAYGSGTYGGVQQPAGYSSSYYRSVSSSSGPQPVQPVQPVQPAQPFQPTQK